MAFLTMAQASEALGGSPSTETLYRLARAGHLPVRRIGRRLLISEHQLARWSDEVVGDVRATVYEGVALRRGAS
jgi:excisionase family DNA binding protein